MSEQVVTYALTTKARIKDRLQITKDTSDTVIDRLISSVTDQVEQACQRRFKETAWADEVHTVRGHSDFLILKQAPVSALSKFQYRVGLPNAIQWLDVPATSYELDENGETGMIRCYFELIQGTNMYRASYTAGYKIDWANAGDPTKHTLPFDLTGLAESLVTKAFKRLGQEQLAGQSFEGSTVNFLKDLDALDQAVLDDYKRLIFL